MDVESGEREFRERLTAILRATPSLMRVLAVARHLCLPDWLVFSGAVYQPVFNHLTGRPLDYGIKDYDLGYFDAWTSAAAAAHIIAAETGSPRPQVTMIRAIHSRAPNRSSARLLGTSKKK